MSVIYADFSGFINFLNLLKILNWFLYLVCCFLIKNCDVFNA
ncbi:hypothetical protein PROSTU_00212 [Providencia stuartii ATCC 25827]|uniref:Uncharacterized protein n=1 Tax=Providencia stuartii ATCC 25827 TaxID=471874 RepID=A0AA86YWL7_PROST|nr:hypothetical protein PROSTU_00212 [Providencia stuartii ATCC 25827]